MRLKPFTTVLTLLLLPTLAHAWGRPGHNLVAAIATARLTPEAQAQVKHLLGNATLVDISGWADDIRRQRRETGPWHYVDIPYEAKEFDPARDGHNGDNIVTKLNEFAAKLADPNLPDADRAEALKFVVHFVGDLHQPLHAADRNNDRGGNARLTFFLDDPRSINLHSVWDSKILASRQGTTTMTVYASALTARITPQHAAEWTATTPEQWAAESHKVAVDVVYNGVPADGPPPRLDQQYVARALDVVDHQIQKAGVRLAHVLNRALAPTSTTATTSATTRPTPTTRPARRQPDLIPAGAD